MRLSVLGGSSPFTAGLFAELSLIEPSDRPSTIVLYGRNAEALAAVQAFARRLPDVRVLTTINIEAALEGADVVLHQIRYGGLEGRAEDEAYCRALGVPADETLGPGGFRAAMRSRPGLSATSAAISRIIPKSLVINLTNPLSLTTSLLKKNGVDRVLGVCELPQSTGATIGQMFSDPVEWDYVGFNHRGFVFDIRVDGKPALDQILQLMPVEGVGQVPRHVIEDFQALPTKYFRLFMGGAPVSQYGRADLLTAIRARLLHQLHSSTDDLPPALSEREQPWWRLAVVPLLRALIARTPLRQILNVPDASGLTREAWFEISEGTVVAKQPGIHPVALDKWLMAFEAHEVACVTALDAPTERNLRRVAKLDPLIGNNSQFRSSIESQPS